MWFSLVPFFTFMDGPHVALTFFWILCILLLMGMLSPRRLKKWTGHSTLILPNPEPLEISLPKFQHFYNYEKYDFSPNLKGVAQKLAPPRPWEVFYVFGGKSKFWAPMTLIFCAKQVFIEVDNWWKFGVDISNHLWEIQNWPFCLSNSLPIA